MQTVSHGEATGPKKLSAHPHFVCYKKTNKLDEVINGLNRSNIKEKNLFSDAQIKKEIQLYREKARLFQEEFGIKIPKTA